MTSIVLTLFRANRLLLLAAVLFFSGFASAKSHEFKFQKGDSAQNPNRVVGCLEVDGASRVDVSINQCIQDTDLQAKIKFFWKMGGSPVRAVGCQLVTEATRPQSLIIDNLPLKECVDNSPFTSEWKRSAQGQVIGCSGRAGFRNLEITIDDFADCLKGMKSRFSLSAIFDHDTRQFTGECLNSIEGSFVGVAGFEKSKCDLTDKEIVQVIYKKRAR